MCLADTLSYSISGKVSQDINWQDGDKDIEETAEGIQERYAIEMEALGIDKNHIHLLSSAHPKISPGEIVRIFESITAKEIFRRHPEIKKEL